MNAGDMVVLAIGDIISLSLVPTVATQVVGIAANENVTGASNTLVLLVTVIFVSVIIGLNVAVLYNAFKQ